MPSPLPTASPAPFSFADAWLFVATVDAGSFRAAADACGLTASGVSKAVSRLEKELGLTLLVRTTRRLRLTDEGALFHERCRDALALLLEAREVATETSRSLKGLLRLGLPPMLGSEIVIPLLRTFLPLHPELSVQLVGMTQASEFFERRVDCAIVTGALDDPTLAGRRLGEGRRITVASPEYLGRRPGPANPGELAKFDCITLVDPMGREAPWLFGGAPAAVNVSGRLRVELLQQAMVGALAGLGIAQLPSTLVDRALDDGRLLRLLPEYESQGIEAWVVYPAQRSLPRRVRAVVDFLVGATAKVQTRRSPR